MRDEFVTREPLTIARTRRGRERGEATLRGVASASFTRSTCQPVPYRLSSPVTCAIVKYGTEGSGTQTKVRQHGLSVPVRTTVRRDCNRRLAF